LTLIGYQNAAENSEAPQLRGKIVTPRASIEVRQHVAVDPVINVPTDLNNSVTHDILDLKPLYRECSSIYLS
jgi:hypothetical protein